METLFQDIRLGIRRLLKSPGFTVIAVLSLALGIGANTAIFSLVNTLLLSQLPIAEPERVYDLIPSRKNSDFANFSYPFYKEFRDQNEVLEGLVAYRFVPMSLSREGNNERFWGYLVSGNYFEVLGVGAAKGRMFTAEDDRVPGGHPVAVMSHACWQKRFASDPDIIGKTITLNSHSFTVVAVAPETFTGTVIIYTPEIYVPMMMARQVEPGSNWLDQKGNGVLFTVARLKSGVSHAQALESLDALGARLGPEFRNTDDIKFSLMPPGLVIPSIRNQSLNFAWVLLATVGLVLLIACMNLANLLLARATTRRKEIAIQLSLGASRARLIRQLLTESVLLSLTGGAVGWMLSLWLIELVMGLKPPIDFALTIALQIDWRVFAFTMLVSLITGIVFGLAPALQATKPDVVPVLKDETGVAGYRRSRLRNGLVIAQVAFSLVMLIAAGLIVRSLQQVQTLGPGFDMAHTVTMSVDLGLQGYDEARGREFFKQLLTRVEAIPGVRSASLADYLPLSVDRSSTSIYIEGQPVPRDEDVPEVQYTAVWARYFETMGIPMVEGREFATQDEKNRYVVVNETFARRFWPGQSAIGKRITNRSQNTFWEIIGIAKDGKYWSLGEDQQPFIYFPMVRDYESSSALVVNTTGDPQNLINTIRREVQNLDGNLPVYDVKTLTEHMRLSLFPLRTGAWIAGSFALLALALAGLGIYGVMAYTVSQRTREIGIRLALGAQVQDVMTLIIKQGMRLAVVGLIIGLGLAFAVTRLMASVLYGVSTTDVVTFMAVTLVLGFVVLLACFVPARRAMKVDPIVALRYE
jgi:macrolide transport system ATP-binding/permease protein